MYKTVFYLLFFFLIVSIVHATPPCDPPTISTIIIRNSNASVETVYYVEHLVDTEELYYLDDMDDATAVHVYASGNFSFLRKFNETEAKNASTFENYLLEKLNNIAISLYDKRAVTSGDILLVRNKCGGALYVVSIPAMATVYSVYRPDEQLKYSSESVEGVRFSFTDFLLYFSLALLIVILFIIRFLRSK